MVYGNSKSEEYKKFKQYEERGTVKVKGQRRRGRVAHPILGALHSGC
jgi:hypothetical protein